MLRAVQAVHLTIGTSSPTSWQSHSVSSSILRWIQASVGAVDRIRRRDARSPGCLKTIGVEAGAVSTVADTVD